MKKYSILLTIVLLIAQHAYSQVPNFHIEGDNPIHTIEANSGNAKLQLTDNFTSTTDDWVLVYDVNDNGQVKWRYNNVSMMTLSNLGNLGLGTTVPEVKLHIKGGPDATLVAGTGFMQFGNTDGVNLVLDNNEILVRDNGVAGNLALQLDGGEVHIGRNNFPAFLRMRGDIQIESDGDLIIPSQGSSNGISRDLEITSSGTVRAKKVALNYNGVISINAHDFVSLSNPGEDHNYNESYRIVYHENVGSNQILTASVRVPQESVIKRVQILYYDNNAGNILIEVLECNKFVNTGLCTEYELHTTSDAVDELRDVSIESLNIPINHTLNEYYIYAMSSSTSAWPGSNIGIKSMTIYYD